MEDFPKEIINQRNALDPIMFEARRQNMKSFLVAEKLIIENKTYTVNSLHTLPNWLKILSIGVKKITDSITALYGSLCWFGYQISNLLPSQMVISFIIQMNNSYTIIKQWYLVIPSQQLKFFLHRPQMSVKPLDTRFKILKMNIGINMQKTWKLDYVRSIVKIS